MSKTVLQHYSNIILLLEQLLHFLKVVIGQPVEPAATTFYTGKLIPHFLLFLVI